MDDEEEEQLPQRCRSPLRNRSSANSHGHFEDRSTQTARDAHMAPFQGSERSATSPCGAYSAPCVSLTTAPGGPDGPRALFHGNAGFRAHFPALFEPVPGSAHPPEPRQAGGGRPEEKEDERGAALSVELQIGRKLRAMGDRFQQEHLQLFSQRGQMGFLQLVTSIYNFLFPREGPRNARAQR